MSNIHWTLIISCLIMAIILYFGISFHEESVEVTKCFDEFHNEIINLTCKRVVYNCNMFEISINHDDCWEKVFRSESYLSLKEDLEDE